MPTRKKDPSARARANKASTAATLHEVETYDYSGLTLAQLRRALSDIGHSTSGRKAELVERLAVATSPIPGLPDRPDGWHAQTIKWWRDVWSSPMSTEWHESDVHNAYICALAYDDMWRSSNAAGRQKAMAEFRQQRSPLGLTPYDRRRLEWTIATAEDATDRGKARREVQTQRAESARAKGPDPRAALHAVN